MPVSSALAFLQSLPARAARALILFYRVTFSVIAGRFCRYAPTCSQYADEAIARHGLWAGGWMGFARICRCRPGGGEGYDPTPPTVGDDASALTPWRYGVWRMKPVVCDEVLDDCASTPGGGYDRGERHDISDRDKRQKH